MARSRQPRAAVGDRIDRSSFEPPYAQLARRLRDAVAEGEYEYGARLPSESELCDAYGVSPMTVRRAVALLVQEGVATTEQGRGTFVRTPELGSATFDLEHLRRHLADPGMEARILSANIVTPSPRVCAKLEVGAQERVIAIKRLLTRGDESVFYHSEYLVFDPRRPVVEAELGVTLLDGLFAGKSAADLRYGRLTLHASALAEGEAAHLGERTGCPAWVIEHLFFDARDRPQSWGRFVCRADRLQFSTTIGLPTRSSDRREEAK